jgi:hypothetical protein
MHIALIMNFMHFLVLAETGLLGALLASLLNPT